MKVDFFSHLASVEDERHEQVTGKRAFIAASQRLDGVQAYLAKAESKDEFEARMATAEGDIYHTVKQACEEHDYANVDEMVKRITAGVVQRAMEKTADGHDKTNYQHETVKLPSSKTGVGAPSPKIDEHRVPKDGLKPIPINSEKHPQTQQTVGDKPVYELDFNPDESRENKIMEEMEAGAPLKEEVGGPTSTWQSGEGNSAGQENPVTSESINDVKAASVRTKTAETETGVWTISLNG